MPAMSTLQNRPTKPSAAPRSAGEAAGPPAERQQTLVDKGFLSKNAGEDVAAQRAARQ
jgi:hypothetical protein